MEAQERRQTGTDASASDDPPPTDPALVVENLSKRFGSGETAVTAVDDVSFSVERGSVVGLLGPNGAGKTTTIKAILGMVLPDAGSVRIDGVDIAAAGDRPVFAIGLRKPPKPVAPIGTDEHRWLDACVFLDPTTLQCRIHGDERYPRTCSTYPAHNLELDAETECERVETAGGGDRLLDDAVPDDTPPLPFGPHAAGATVFAHPDPNDLDGVIDRIRGERLTPDDRARFVGAAVGSSPGSLSVDRDRMAEARSLARDADSWAGRAIRSWSERATGDGDPVALDAAARERLVHELEDDAGAPETSGWD